MIECKFVPMEQPGHQMCGNIRDVRASSMLCLTLLKSIFNLLVIVNPHASFFNISNTRSNISWGAGTLPVYQGM